MTSNILVINGASFADIVEKDSYTTEMVPVTKSLTTLDGVDHIVLLRERGVVRFTTNPMTQERYAALCTALSGGVVTVRYTSLQTGEARSANMSYETKSAGHIPRCRYLDKKWVDGVSVQLTEL